ncbi:MAG: DUF1559 domain-containing protein [Thermoguttaceae bacterium]
MQPNAVRVTKTGSTSQFVARGMTIFRRAIRGQCRAAFTLVEMLVVVTIIAMLLGMLMPAVNSARESARQTTCQSNLHEFGAGFASNANRLKQFCSGTFDWQREGSVTDVGWVADLVNTGTAVGKMLCPSNPSQISDTYNDLLSAAANYTGTAGCTGTGCTGTWYNYAWPQCVVDPRGSVPLQKPDGTYTINPCRFILEGSASTPGGTFTAMTGTTLSNYIQTNVLKKFFNTNYTASWYFVRSGVLLDANGNLVSTGGCATTTYARACTAGPLSPSTLDSSPAQSSTVPLLACGGTAGTLSAAIGAIPGGSPTTLTFTPGPVMNLTVNPLTPGPGSTVSSTTFAVGTAKATWWATWNNNTLQDFRGFAPVHRYQCNILFADGSVRGVTDLNKDGFLNNGFQSATGAPVPPFADTVTEIDSSEVYSQWSLRP